MRDKIMLAQLYTAKAQKLLKKGGVTPDVLQHARLLSMRAFRILNREVDVTGLSAFVKYRIVFESYSLVLKKMGGTIAVRPILKMP